jgi:hypothetical protein
MILIFFSIIFIRAEAFGERSLYDNFTGPYIDAQKWYNREFVREVDPVNGKLVSKIGNASGTGTFRNMTEFQDPASITTLECDITLVKTILDTGSYPTSFARIEGFFYNTQSTGGAKGDIWAAVVIGDRGYGLEAWWEVEEFLDDDMTSWDTWTDKLIDPGGITYNTVYPIKIAYDGTNGFEFTVGDSNDSYAVDAPWQRDAITQIKTLTTGINAQEGSGTGYASALFDNVYINDQPYDDFETAPLNPSKWKDLESVTEISNGKRLRSNVQADGSETTAIIYATNRSAFYLEAEVAVESGGLVSTGAIGAARVGGYYYNESRGPGSLSAYNKYEGNVWGDIRIEVDHDNDLKAKAVVVRSNDADASVWTFRFSQDFITEIVFDTLYTLSIEFTGSAFIFTCDDESWEYEVTTNTYDPYNESRSLSSRIYAESGQEGYVQANFDDMYIDYVPTDTTDPAEEKECFIATAAYGSPMEPHVKVLREFRDRFLVTNSVGQAFIKLYYMTSPPIADYISEHESLRTATRWSLTPVIYGVKHPKAIILIVFGLGMVVAGYTRVRKR